MTLIRNGEIIVLVRRKKKLFLLDLTHSDKAMPIIYQKTIVTIKRR